MAAVPVAGIRARLKTALLGASERLTAAGHPRLGAGCVLPVDVVRRVRSLRDRAVRRLRPIILWARGRWVPFLRPEWGLEEWRAASAPPSARGETAEAIRASLENEFLATLNLNPAANTAVATSSGRTALRLALRILARERPERREVIVPAYCCLGVLEPILQCGLVPVFADVGDGLNATRATMAPALSERTLACIAVHLGGRRMTDLPDLARDCAAAGAAVIEDACQAMGTAQETAGWGAGSDFSVYSFGLGKNLMATAGGMLVAHGRQEEVLRAVENLEPEPDRAAAARFAYLARAHASHWRSAWGLTPNRPADAFASAFGDRRIARLDAVVASLQIVRRLESIQAGRRRNAELLLQAMAGSRLAVTGQTGKSLRTKFMVVAPSVEFAQMVRRALRQRGVETETMYTPLHLRSEGRAYARGSLPQCEAVYERTFCLPVRPSLSERQMAWVARSVREALARAEGAESVARTSRLR